VRALAAPLFSSACISPSSVSVRLVCDPAVTEDDRFEAPAAWWLTDRMAPRVLIGLLGVIVVAGCGSKERGERPATAERTGS
jgi:hypothetical protein